MNPKYPFKRRHFESEIILLCVRWYLRYPLSYRNLEEIMSERGLSVDHTTIYRWVQRYAPELEKRCRLHLKLTNDSWRVDETYIKVKGKWKYLYRAVDSGGNTIDFMLSATRDKRAAKRFFCKALKATHSQLPRVINVDKNAAYLPSIENLKAESTLPQACELRQNKYLNNMVEQDHRFIKRLVNPGLGFKSFYTARRTIMGYETMHRIRKGQLQGVEKGNILGQVEFVSQLFGVAA
ncbi:IS6 family transposase [Chroococcidiopsis sp. FACHB-1243]|uniref:IS6 family transposase n=1 Tax=Chroococcidiopsis sp. [FACHB-1243] TaxID=2692781 RepID=UPI0017818A38|nr:IS6 family transposase [Chroococcidiopsis sp. [FACHB-1243]]MBD2307803.1 IS6 family transposase [Chroococcidiopsis sp. [FACHB-1243]]